jgi:ParB family chromosome partitioning protein
MSPKPNLSAILNASLAAGKSAAANVSTAESRLDAYASTTNTLVPPSSNIAQLQPTSTNSPLPQPRKLGRQKVALALIHDNPYDARRVRRPTDELKLAESMKKNGQESPARGYWREDGTCGLFFGHQRKRAAIHLGWPELEVDMVPPPASNEELYLVSRRENIERSVQTPLDDALAWSLLLEEGIYATQDDLAAAVGVAQGTVAKALSIAKLPTELMDECIKYDILNPTMLYSLLLFHKESGNIETTSDLIKEIKDGKVSTRDVEARTKRLRVEKEAGGPQVIRKPRSDIHKVVFAGARGELKEFAEKGRVELKIDLKDNEARAKLMTALKGLFVA